jgi:hypothetical protein
VGWLPRSVPFLCKPAFFASCLLFSLSALSWFLAWLTLQPRRWRWQFPPKSEQTLNKLYGVIFQKNEHFWIQSFCVHVKLKSAFT